MPQVQPYKAKKKKEKQKCNFYDIPIGTARKFPLEPQDPYDKPITGHNVKPNKIKQLSETEMLEMARESNNPTYFISFDLIMELGSSSLISLLKNQTQRCQDTCLRSHS